MDACQGLTSTRLLRSDRCRAILFGMKRLSLLLSLWWVACDYAPAEEVTHLSMKVERVEAEQRALGTQQRTVLTEVESTALAQQALKSDFTQMGVGFNSLTENMIQQEDRMEHVEKDSQRLQSEFGKLRDSVGDRPNRKPPQDPPIYTGVRLDTRTYDESTVRLQWCESDEGTQGFLIPYGDELFYDDLHCWQFGDAALFRAETPDGPVVTCLRNITFESDGSLKALDCDVPGVLYHFSGAPTR